MSSIFGSNGALNTSVKNNFTIVANRPASNNRSMFVNTTPNAFVNNMVVGVYGVFNNLVTVAEGKGVKDVSTGWYIRRSGMGPVTNVIVSAGGSGYSNSDLLRITANGCITMGGNVTTNSTGGVVGFTNLSNTNALYPNTAYVTVAIANSSGGTPNGTLFTGTVTLGGRAGRHHNEMLVSMPSMTGNATINSAAFPNA